MFEFSSAGSLKSSTLTSSSPPAAGFSHLTGIVMTIIYEYPITAISIYLCSWRIWQEINLIGGKSAVSDLKFDMQYPIKQTISLFGGINFRVRLPNCQIYSLPNIQLYMVSQEACKSYVPYSNDL